MFPHWEVSEEDGMVSNIFSGFEFIMVKTNPLNSLSLLYIKILDP